MRICIAKDVYSGHRNGEQLASARTKVHKMKPDETGGLAYSLKLLIGKPYMVRANIDVVDGLVNGAISVQRYIELDHSDANKGDVKRLWLEFKDTNIGKLLRCKCQAYVRTVAELDKKWVLISKRSTTITLPSKIISCKRQQFTLIEACAKTIDKSQGGTLRSCWVENEEVIPIEGFRQVSQFKRNTVRAGIQAGVAI